MIEEINGIRYIGGDTRTLLVSPHSPVIDGKYENDIRTGRIVEAVQQRTGCSAIINDRFLKPTPDISKSIGMYRLDMFKAAHAQKVPGYLDRIRQIADSEGRTLVLWVHGIADDVALSQGREHVADGRFGGPPDALHALIGYGQKSDARSGENLDSLSARYRTAEAFRQRLTAGGMTALLTRRKSALFRGHHAKRLNQWFNQSGYGPDRVESIQLEIRERGFRDTDANALKTAGIIAKALSSLPLAADR